MKPIHLLLLAIVCVLAALAVWLTEGQPAQPLPGAPQRGATAIWTIPPYTPPTHIPTITLTRTATRQATLFILPVTATPTREHTPIPSPTFTATVSPTIAPPNTAMPSLTPSSTPTETPIPTMRAGRNLTPIVVIPNAGASETEIAEMTPSASETPTSTPTPTLLSLPSGCTFYSLLSEIDKTYTELTFRCPNATAVLLPAGGTD